MTTHRELIVPVFIPHAGCAHSCVFCNQQNITGRKEPPAPDEVREYLSTSLGTGTPRAVIAFYGGSFTCLPRAEQERYLEAAAGFVRAGHARHIRLSTRPDCMDADTAGFLHGMGVRTVELGVQSMDERVLGLSARGHGVDDIIAAALAVKGSGLELGLQIMAGLPGDTPESFMRTVREVAGLEPDFVRIYPALVVRGAALERLHSRGEYVPLPLDEAVRLCADATEVFGAAGIKVVRTGLQPSEELEASLVAGPYHPAFGHMVASETAFRRMLAAARELPPGNGHKAVEFIVNQNELSTYLGIRKANIPRLSDALGGMGVSVRADSSVPAGDLRVSYARP